MVCSAQEWHHSQWAELTGLLSPWMTPHQSLIRKCPHKLTYQPIWWEHRFLNWVSLFLDEPSLWQFQKQTNQQTNKPNKKKKKKKKKNPKPKSNSLRQLHQKQVAYPSFSPFCQPCSFPIPIPITIPNPSAGWGQGRWSQASDKRWRWIAPPPLAWQSSY